MGSKRENTMLEYYASEIQTKQKKVCESTCAKNYIAVSQAIEDIHSDRQQVKEIRVKLNGLKKTSGHKKEYEVCENGLNLVDDLTWQRKRCLETVLYVSEVENLFQNVQNEFEDRALYLSKRRAVFDSVYRDEEIEYSSRMHKECTYDIRKGWSWISDLTKCMDIHVTNAANYHQYQHDVQHISEDMEAFITFLNSENMRKPVKTTDPKVMSHHFKFLLSRLMDYQGRIQKLTEMAGNIHPITFRKELPPYPVKARSLVQYTHKEIHLEKDDICTILDISDKEKWKVQTKDNVTSDVPAIVLVIPPPDPECYLHVKRLRDQLRINWNTTLNCLRRQLIEFMSLLISKETQAKEFQGIHSMQRSEFLKLTNDAFGLAQGVEIEESQYNAFKAQTTFIRKLLTQLKPGNKILKNRSIEMWNGAVKLFRQYFDLLAYLKSFNLEMYKRMKQNCLLITVNISTRTYLTKAYFERFLPMVNIDTSLNKPEISKVCSQLYIHERLRKKESVESLKKKENKLLNRMEDMIPEPACQFDGSKPFVIVGVIDPRNGERLSVFQAISYGILDQEKGLYINPDTSQSIGIPEAITKGSILIEYSDDSNNEDAFVRNKVDYKMLGISGVIDPATGEVISIKEAIAKGLLDIKSNLFKNSVSNEVMSLSDAIKAGYIIIDPENFNDFNDKNNFFSLEMVDLAYAIESVTDPVSGEEITMQAAIERGILDIKNGLYKDATKGENISISEAIKMGLITGRQVSPMESNNKQNHLSFQECQIKKQKFSLQCLSKGEDGFDNTDSINELANPNEILFTKVKEHIDSQNNYIKHPLTGENITIEDAFKQGIINFSKAEYDTLDGDILPLQTASAKGFIEPYVLRQILKIYEEASIGNLIDSGQFDPDTGLVIDVPTGHTLSLKAAISQKIINPETIFFYDAPTQKIMSVSTAVDTGRTNLSTGKIVNTATGAEMTVREAISSNEIIAHINPSDVTEYAESLLVLDAVMDTSIQGIHMAASKEVLSVKEAVSCGLLRIPSVTFAYGEETSTVHAAVQTAKIDPECGLALYGAFQKLSLNDALKSKILDGKKGKLIVSSTGESIPVSSAQEKGLRNPNYIFLVDNEEKKVVSLGEYMNQGNFNPSTGKVFHKRTGRAMTIEDAIKEKLIDPNVNPEKFVNIVTTLRDLIDSGLVNPRSSSFIAPNNLEILLRDGLANGLLTMSSKVKLDKNSGNIILMSNEDVVKILVDVKRHSDWLADVEKSLGSQLKPREKLVLLKKQMEETKAIDQNLKKNEPDLRVAIKQAEDLIKNKETLESDEGQQYKKLKYNSSDLRVRLDSASSQTKMRNQKLEAASESLQTFYGRLEKLDKWMDTAIETTQELLSIDILMEDRYHALKDFYDEIQEKDDEIIQVSKIADNFCVNAQNFGRELDIYRKSLQILPTINEDVETGILDDELDSIEAKYKDISSECLKQLDQLSVLMKSKHKFDDLNSRLSSTYAPLRKKLMDGNIKNIGVDPRKDSSNLKELKKMKADLIVQERKLKDLTTTGEMLISGLEEAGLTKEADDVRNTVDDHKVKYSDLFKDVSIKHDNLESAVAEQLNTMAVLDGILNFMENADKSLRSNQQISLDKDKLIEQIHEQRLMNDNIISNKSLLNKLLNTDDGTIGSTEKLMDINEKLEGLEELAEIRTYELEDFLKKVNNFEQKTAEVDLWLSECINKLKSKSKANSAIAKSQIESVYEEKKVKEDNINDLRNTCNSLISNEKISDYYVIKERLGDVESKWNDLTEFLVQQVSLEALSKIDGMLKYLDKAENEINTAEAISVDPETLEVQLKDHMAFHEDLTQKRNAVKEIINKCNKMLRETTNSQTDEITSRLDSIHSQADVVCHLSSERLHQLESALPLASHYSDTQAEVSAWLEEIEAELRAQGKPGDSLEQVKKQYDHLKGTQQIILDQKPFIDDLNSTGLELMELCGEKDGNEIQTKLVESNHKYEELRNCARSKARNLTDAKQKFNQEVSDSLDHLLEELSQLQSAVSNADPIPASPEKLKNEIDEIMALKEDLERLWPELQKVKDSNKNIRNNDEDDLTEVEDFKSRVNDITKLYKKVDQDSNSRKNKLSEALSLSEKLFDISSDTMDSLRDLKDNLYAQESPGIDPSTVKEQQSELEGLGNELDKARDLMLDCRRIGDDLGDICGEPGKIEIKKQLEDLVNTSDDVADLIRDRKEELGTALGYANRYLHLQDSINSWLPLAEHNLAAMRPPSRDPIALKDQIDELKILKSNIHGHVSEMQQFNQEFSALKELSPVASESLLKGVEIVNDKWNDIICGIAEREGTLNDMQVKLGKLDHAMDDIVSSLKLVERGLNEIGCLNGDPKSLETKLNKLQLLKSDIQNQDKAIFKIHKAVDDLLCNSPDQEDSVLRKKRLQMDEQVKIVQASSREKETKLQDNLRKVKRYLGDVDDLLQWLNDFRMELKLNQPFGALPDTSSTQHEAFLKKCEEMDSYEKTVQNLLMSGKEIVENTTDGDCKHVSDRVKKLQDRWSDTRDRAKKRKEKMEEHVKNVSEFHGTLKAFTDWLNNTEVMMRGLKYPSKLVDVITQQIVDHNNLTADLEVQANLMLTLDKSGTYLKYFGRKQDTIYIKNLLVGIRLRWKKLLRKADERGRLLKQAYKEDKRFYDSWKELCDWLDGCFSRLSGDVKGTNKVVKQEIEELKKFEHQLSIKNPAFYTTTRLGRNLKDRCTKNDPERDVLNDMLEQLKRKWNAVKSIISKSQSKLDEALLTSGRVSDAIQSLIEWLHKAENTLEDCPVLGDLDTVNMLVELNKGVKQELQARKSTIETMKNASNIPYSLKEDLLMLWEKVTDLCDLRENQLKDSLKLAEEFQDVVTVMREFLPQAEAELKLRGLPVDEVAIIQLMEQHDKFQEELESHQSTIDRIKMLAEEILQGCHPNGVRFVKYYLTITQTRWDQLLEKAKDRAERLEEALNGIKGNAALLEELLAWLTDAQALLATKESDPIPEDLKVVETLLGEHLEFHEEVTSRNADAERLTKLVSTEGKFSPAKNFGSNMRLNDIDVNNPRVTALHNKWRVVWRMSVERKKKLQDAYDTLLELESFKNFDFDVWRLRYRKWIQAKKFRISDFFRRQDKDCDGAVSREEFVQGMLQSKFPSNKTELNAVFDIFEQQINRKPRMVTKDFIDALKADKRSRRRSSSSAQKTDVDLIHDEIEREIANCHCRNQFKAVCLEEGKYKFGEKLRMYLVRFLNSTVMVRVGGGWITLEEFLETNDPCRAKGRMNTDLREHIGTPDNIGYNRRGSGISFRSISPFPTGTKNRGVDDSSNSSASGSADSSLRRSRITSSMVNLSNGTGLKTNPDFGSTGSLSRSKRLSSSSTSLTSGVNSRPKSKTPTPQAATHRRSGTLYTRSTTPTPSSRGHGSRPTTPTSRGHGSRPTTPTSFTSRNMSSSNRSGSTTPTSGLTSKGRQLPRTPKSAPR